MSRHDIPRAVDLGSTSLENRKRQTRLAARAAGSVVLRGVAFSVAAAGVYEQVATATTPAEGLAAGITIAALGVAETVTGIGNRTLQTARHTVGQIALRALDRLGGGQTDIPSDSNETLSLQHIHEVVTSLSSDAQDSVPDQPALAPSTYSYYPHV
ncbi:MAG TPA: hypothetical protein VMB52_05510 [Verrucomicrobiae bacterium]|nr:hypothetical protein [Verrucomicrobiae bacterium]